MEKKMKAEIGDIIRCQGRTVVIREIYEQWSDPWMIEGQDQNERYFMWKQQFDGGVFEKAGEKK